MTDTDGLIRDLWALREQINREWKTLEEMSLTDKERAAIRLHLNWAIDDLAALLKRLGEDDADGSEGREHPAE